LITQDPLKLPDADVNVKLGDNWLLDEQVKRSKDNPQQGYVRAFVGGDERGGEHLDVGRTHVQQKHV
jgi:hypothetical protein